MRKTTFTILGALTVICAASVATAEPAGIILVRDGCGLGSHRGPLGYCRPNGFPVRRLGGVLGGNCPPSYHLGPFGNRCRSDF